MSRRVKIDRSFPSVGDRSDDANEGVVPVVDESTSEQHMPKKTRRVVVTRKADPVRVRESETEFDEEVDYENFEMGDLEDDGLLDERKRISDDDDEGLVEVNSDAHIHNGSDADMAEERTNDATRDSGAVDEEPQRSSDNANSHNVRNDEEQSDDGEIREESNAGESSHISSGGDGRNTWHEQDDDDGELEDGEEKPEVMLNEHLEFRIDSRASAGLIGRRGRVVEDLKDRHNVFIRLLEPSYHDDLERTVVLEGLIPNIDAAFEDIRRILNSEGRSTCRIMKRHPIQESEMLSRPRRHNSSRHERHRSFDVDTAPPIHGVDSYSTIHVVELRVPYKCVGLLIGERGATIRDMESHFHVSIDVEKGPRSTMPGDRIYRYMKVSGRGQNLDDALERIRQMVHADGGDVQYVAGPVSGSRRDQPLARGGRNARDMRLAEMECTFPHISTGMIIGERGTMISALESRFRSRIIVVKEPHRMFQPHDERVLQMKGTVADLENLVVALNDLLGRDNVQLIVKSQKILPQPPTNSNRSSYNDTRSNDVPEISRQRRHSPHGAGKSTAQRLPRNAQDPQYEREDQPSQNNEQGSPMKQIEDVSSPPQKQSEPDHQREENSPSQQQQQQQQQKNQEVQSPPEQPSPTSKQIRHEEDSPSTQERQRQQSPQSRESSHRDRHREEHSPPSSSPPPPPPEQRQHPPPSRESSHRDRHREERSPPPPPEYRRHPSPPSRESSHRDRHREEDLPSKRRRQSPPSREVSHRDRAPPREEDSLQRRHRSPPSRETGHYDRAPPRVEEVPSQRRRRSPPSRETGHYDRAAPPREEERRQASPLRGRASERPPSPPSRHRHHDYEHEASRRHESPPSRKKSRHDRRREGGGARRSASPPRYQRSHAEDSLHRQRPVSPRGERRRDRSDVRAPQQRRSPRRDSQYEESRRTSNRREEHSRQQRKRPRERRDEKRSFRHEHGRRGEARVSDTKNSESRNSNYRLAKALVPTYCTRFLIGKRGERISGIETVSQAKVQIDKHSYRGTSMTLVEVSGPPFSVDLALQQLEGLLKMKQSTMEMLPDGIERVLPRTSKPERDESPRREPNESPRRAPNKVADSGAAQRKRPRDDALHGNFTYISMDEREVDPRLFKKIESDCRVQIETRPADDRRETIVVIAGEKRSRDLAIRDLESAKLRFTVRDDRALERREPNVRADTENHVSDRISKRQRSERDYDVRKRSPVAASMVVNRTSSTWKPRLLEDHYDADPDTSSAHLGEGTYGSVHAFFDRRNRDKVAVKRVKMEKEKEGFPVTAIREIKTLQRLTQTGSDDTCVVRLHDVVSSRDKSTNLVFEFMDHDMAGLMDRQNLSSRAQIKYYIRCVLEALAHCHAQDPPILHRDVKSANILVSNDGRVRLADFGLTREWTSKLTERVVTLWYRAPEVLLGANDYTAKIDTWAAGCFLAEMLRNGKPLFRGTDEFSQLMSIYKVCGTPTEVNWPDYRSLPLCSKFEYEGRHDRCLNRVFENESPQCVHLLDKLLQLDPFQRISAQTALQHPYFTEELPRPLKPQQHPRYKGHNYELHTRRRKKKR